MPTYEYACTSCDEHLEVVQSFKDDPLTECPVCGGTLRKVFAPIGVVFKGSGFYKTDSRSTSTKGRAGSAGDKTSESASAPASDSTGGSGKDTSSTPGSSGSTTSSSTSGSSTSGSSTSGSSGSGAGAAAS